MLENWETAIIHPRLVLTPYRASNVPTYHAWMTDPDLLAATASEPLSLVEEEEMQQSWKNDQTKLTFIVNYRPATGAKDEVVPIGDVNLFLHDPVEEPFVGEIEIMIADEEHQRKGLATLALQLFMRYCVVALNVRTFVAKIGASNASSVALFTTKLSFVETAYVEAFDEYEFRFDVANASKTTWWSQFSKTYMEEEYVLVDVETTERLWNDASEALVEAKKIGNAHYNADDFASAIGAFTVGLSSYALKLFDPEFEAREEAQQRLDRVPSDRDRRLSVLYSNRSAALLKQLSLCRAQEEDKRRISRLPEPRASRRRAVRAVNDAKSSVRCDPDYLKGYFRLAKASAASGDDRLWCVRRAYESAKSRPSVSPKAREFLANELEKIGVGVCDEDRRARIQSSYHLREAIAHSDSATRLCAIATFWNESDDATRTACLRRVTTSDGRRSQIDAAHEFPELPMDSFEGVDVPKTWVAYWKAAVEERVDTLAKLFHRLSATEKDLVLRDVEYYFGDAK